MSQDHRNDENYEQWNKDYEKYQGEIKKILK